MVNVQKHKLFLSLLLLTITGIFSACTDETEQIGIHNGTPLDINVGVNTTESRAVITGNSLPDGSQIGVTVVDQSGTDYQDQDYNNVCYQAVTEDGSQKWKVQSRSDILLSGEAGTLYAYYPWSSAVSNIKQIAVNMDETDQKDWMVAQPVTDLSDAQATAAVKMQHMLTNFKLSFYKDNYSGKGEVTAVTIRSNGFATTGTLDATTGEFTAYGETHTLTRIFTTTLGTDKAEAASCEIVVVPNTVAAPVTVSVTVDGNTYSSVTSSLTLAKAKSYNYAMKLSSTGLEITEVTLTDWNTEDLGDTQFKPEGTEQQDPYAEYLQLTYNVIDNSTPTQIFYSKSSFDIVSVSEMVVLENDGLRAAAEAVSVTPSKTYQFSKTGIHTVYIKFVDMTNIPNYAFRDCTVLEEVIIPKSLITIGKQAFYGCAELTEMTIGNSVTSIGERTFYNCTDLISINIPESVTSIGNYAFAGCNKIERINVEVNNAVFDSRDNCNAVIATATNTLVLGCKSTMIPKSVTLIGEYAFAYCSGLTSITIPTSVKKIGESAFLECTGLTGELVIPNSVTSIGVSAFRGCQGLTEIAIPESVTKIESGVFMSCKGLTEVTIPNTVTLLDNNSFDSCSGLIEVTIGSGVQTINSSVFTGCTGMQKITIGESVKSIGESAFYRCTGLTTIISLAKTAPNIEKTTFWTVKTNGILYVPTNSSGYDKWTKQGNTSNNEYYLGNYNWTKSYIQ